MISLNDVRAELVNHHTRRLICICMYVCRSALVSGRSKCYWYYVTQYYLFRSRVIGDSPDKLNRAIGLIPPLSLSGDEGGSRHPAGSKTRPFKRQRGLLVQQPSSTLFLGVLDPLFFVMLSNKETNNSDITRAIDVIIGYLASAYR